MHHLLPSLIQLGAIVIAILGLVVIRRRRRAPRRELEGAKQLAIAAIPEGERVKITGVAGNRDALITSPVGGHPCIGFSLVIRWGASLANQVLEKRDCRPFLLTDETGTVVVDGPFLFALDVDDGAWANLPPSVYTLLEDELGKKKASAYADGSGDLRFQEALLKPGDRISVIGRSSMELDPAGHGSYRDPPTLNHIRGSDKDPVIIADAEDPAV